MRTADSPSAAARCVKGEVGSFARISIHEGGKAKEEREGKIRRRGIRTKKGIVDAPASALNNSPLFDERFESSDPRRIFKRT